MIRFLPSESGSPDAPHGPGLQPTRPESSVGGLTGLLVGLALLARCVAADGPVAPQPFGAVPSARQLRWHQVEFYGLIHFGLNTFTDREWGFGDESPDLFAPTAFDAQKVVAVAQAAGMRGLILVCKHHDGFCLWPSRHTPYSVKASPWRSGTGDVVKELSDACRERGLRFGVYLSPWDRNHPDYGRPEYLLYFRAQLEELLANYGDLFMCWFDGAIGGSGYYGGSRETRRIDRSTYYGWPQTWEIVRRLQPDAAIFSDVGPDVRWIGNERGQADDPCWYTLRTEGLYPGGPNAGSLARGHRGAPDWVPPECDVSIRPGWFYHQREDARVKAATTLLDIFYTSVGRGACLNLNIPLDQRGLIPDKDEQILRRFGAIVQRTFARDLTQGSRAVASHARGNGSQSGPSTVTDGDPTTYWTTNDGELTPELTLEMPQPTSFSVVRLREFLPLGQRIEGFALDLWTNGQWQEFARGSSVGAQRLLRFPRVTTSRLRLRITKAAACPAISEVGLFLEPSLAVFR